MMGGGMLGTGFGWFGLFGMAFNLILIVGVVVLVVWAVQRFTSPGRGSEAGRNHNGATLSARDILDQRYARGELSREQYQEKLHDISV